MNILVFGASRGVGLRVAQQALEAGHRVTAVARSLVPLGGSTGQLTIRQADIQDPFAVNSLVAGHDVVVVAIGALPGFQPVYCFSQGTARVIEAMRAADCRRLIVVTGIGAGESRKHGGWLYDHLFQPFVLGRIYDDKNRQEALVRESRLDWIIVRPGFLTHGPRSDDYHALKKLDGVVCGKVSRADVAHFIVGQFSDKCYLNEAVLLTA